MTIWNVAGFNLFHARLPVHLPIPGLGCTTRNTPVSEPNVTFIQPTKRLLCKQARYPQAASCHQWPIHFSSNQGYLSLVENSRVQLRSTCASATVVLLICRLRWYNLQLNIWGKGEKSGYKKFQIKSQECNSLTRQNPMTCTDRELHFRFAAENKY